MTTKRRNRFSFQDAPTTSRAICSSCWDRNITVKTVEYIMSNGKPDKNFRQCPYCFDIIPVRQTRHLSETVPLGGNNIGQTKFEVAESSRTRSRRDKVSDGPEVFNVNDYKLPNGEVDKDLVHYATQGEIVSVNDSGNDGDDTE